MDVAEEGYAAYVIQDATKSFDHDKAWPEMAENYAPKV